MIRGVKEAGHLGQNLFTLGLVISPQKDLARPLLLHFLHDEGACFTDLDGWSCHGRPPGSNALPHFIRGVVEKGDQLIILFLGDGIVKMIVTLGAFEGCAQPNRAGHVDPVKHLIGSAGLLGRSAFRVEGRGPMKPRSHLLGKGCIGQKIARELLDGELIEGHVIVEGLHDPVSPCPTGPYHVLVNTSGITVAGEVEPVARPPLSKMG